MAAVSANRPATGWIWKWLRHRNVCDRCGARARLQRKRAVRTMRTARKRRARRLLEPGQEAPVNRRSFHRGADAPGDGRPSVVRRPGDLRRCLEEAGLRGGKHGGGFQLAHGRCSLPAEGDLPTEYGSELVVFVRGHGQQGRFAPVSDIIHLPDVRRAALQQDVDGRIVGVEDRVGQVAPGEGYVPVCSI